MSIGELVIKGVKEAAAARRAARAAEEAAARDVPLAVKVASREKPQARAPIGITPPPAAPKPKVVVKPKPVAAPAIIKARSGTPLAVAQDVLQEAASPSKSRMGYGEWRAANPGAGDLFDMSRLSEVPNVPQVQMPRYEAPRGPSARIQEALARPEVEQGINDTVQRGIEGGGLEWYNTEPVLDRMRQLQGSDADQQYAALMDRVAATSPRAKVPDNIRTASYYNYLRSQGLPTPDKPAAGYGSIAQGLHQQNVRGLDELGGWDIFKNPKPASFSTNLQGNQMNATIDTHNFRLPGILSGDPRFLETSIAELAKNPDVALETLRRQYPGLPEKVVQGAVKSTPGKTSITYRPQQWVNEGHIPMEQAVNDPALWASKPNPNEYGHYERWQQDQAKKMGITPAQYQASMWLGGGDTTGLGSAAEPFLGTLAARMRYTRDMMLKGEIPLLAAGGPVRRPSYAVDMDTGRRR
jgi:hypothetical protein